MENRQVQLMDIKNSDETLSKTEINSDRCDNNCEGHSVQCVEMTAVVQQTMTTFGAQEIENF